MLAEADSTQNIIVTAIVSVLVSGGIGTGLVAAWKSWRENSQKRDTDALSEWIKIHDLDVLERQKDAARIEALTARIEALVLKVADLQRRELECEFRCSRLDSKIQYMIDWAAAMKFPMPNKSADDTRIDAIPSEVQ